MPGALVDRACVGVVEELESVCSMQRFFELGHLSLRTGRFFIDSNSINYAPIMHGPYDHPTHTETTGSALATPNRFPKMIHWQQ